MKLMVLILNKVEALEPLLARFAQDHINGATILSSSGMARAISSYEEFSFLNSLQMILNTEGDENKTVMVVMEDEQIPTAISAIEDIVGNLYEPNTGIMFTLPIDFFYGLRQ